MTQQEMQVIANRSLNALNDNRVMIPADAVEALADLKNVLRQLMAGTSVVILNNPEPVAVDDA